MVNFAQPNLFIDTSFITANAVDAPASPTHPENLSVSELVSIVLNKIVDGNKNVPMNDDSMRQDIFIKFQSSYEPDITICSYLERIRKYSKCSDACFILMLIYIDRLIEKKGLVLTKLNIHRLLITSMMIAAKYHDDLFYNNAYFAKLGGLSLSELNGLELEILTYLDYSMFISLSLYEKYSHQLYNYKFMMHTPNSKLLGGVNNKTILNTPVIFGNEINWNQQHQHQNGIRNGVMSEVPTPTVPATCVNAFQFSPHFLAPHQGQGHSVSSSSVSSISPCGSGSVASRSSNGYGAPSSLESFGSMSSKGSINNAAFFPFSRTCSLDSLTITSTSAVSVEDSFAAFEAKTLGVAGGNGYFYPSSHQGVVPPNQGGIAANNGNADNLFKKSLGGNRGYFNPYGGFPPQAPTVQVQVQVPTFPFPAFPTGNFMPVNMPPPPNATNYIPMAPHGSLMTNQAYAALSYPNNSDMFIHQAPSQGHHQMQQQPQGQMMDRSFVNRSLLPQSNCNTNNASSSKKRAHNDIYEGNNNNIYHTNVNANVYPSYPTHPAANNGYFTNHVTPQVNSKIIGSQIYSMENNNHHHAMPHHPYHIHQQQQYFQPWNNKAFSDFPEQIRLAALN